VEPQEMLVVEIPATRETQELQEVQGQGGMEVEVDCQHPSHPGAAAEQVETLVETLGVTAPAVRGQVRAPVEQGLHLEETAEFRGQVLRLALEEEVGVEVDLDLLAALQLQEIQVL
jgi:hypothetical protein